LRGGRVRDPRRAPPRIVARRKLAGRRRGGGPRGGVQETDLRGFHEGPFLAASTEPPGPLDRRGEILLRAPRRERRSPLARHPPADLSMVVVRLLGLAGRARDGTAGRGIRALSPA